MDYDELDEKAATADQNQAEILEPQTQVTISAGARRDLLFRGKDRRASSKMGARADQPQS